MTPKDAPENVDAVALAAPRCHLGEGPAYDPIRDGAWWFDILERRLLEADLATGAVKVHALPFMASALAWIDDARQLIAAEDGLHIRDVRSGDLSFYLALGAGSGTRSNDGRTHPSGALWISTMGRGAEPGAGAIHHVLGGEVSRLYGGLAIPNAICFSPDGRTAYFADTLEGILYRVAVDPADGKPLGAPESLHDHRGGKGGLDGATVDAEGMIWNARWGAGCLDAYTPDGQRARSIGVPAAQPSCPAFVGRDLRRLLVTTAHEGMSEADKRADPQHGRTFVMDVGARGRPEPRVKLGAA